MRAVDDGTAEPGRFDRVLSAMRHQRAPDKGNIRQSEKKAEFAHGVCKQEADIPLQGLAAAADAHGISGFGEFVFDLCATGRMTRNDNGQDIGEISDQYAMGCRYNFLFAGMGAECEPAGPCRCRRFERSKRGRIRG
jgi:hypothetical protein